MERLGAWTGNYQAAFDAACFAPARRARKTPDQEEWTRLIDRLILEAAALWGTRAADARRIVKVPRVELQFVNDGDELFAIHTFLLFG